MKKITWIFLLAAFFIFLTRSILIGAVLEPILSKELTNLFGMPVSIRGLRADPLYGRVWASRVIFMNQPEFAPGPHLDVKGLKFDIDFWALTQKRVLIGTIFLNEPYYFIDRIATPKGPNNNVSTWVDHIEGPEDSSSTNSGPSQWKVSINEIVLHNGTFILNDTSSEEARKKLVFEKLNGSLVGFKWPSDPAQFPQHVRLQGTFGEKYPAPFWIEGVANFSTSKVGFDLKGEVPEGHVMDHRLLWEGLPVQVTDGKYQLRVHTFCKLRNLKSESLLKLESLKVTPRASAGGLMWGLPMMASIGFLESQKAINLKVSVHGNIKDPKFEFTKAFRKAFQESLARRTQNGLGLIRKGSAKIASGTEDLMRQTPTRLAEGWEKMTNLVSTVVPRMGIMPNPPSARVPDKDPQRNSEVAT